MMKPHVMPLSLAALLAALLPGCGGGNKNDSPGGDRGGPPIKVTAEQLSKDFVADHRAAGQKYGVRMLEVEGTVVGINGPERVVRLEGTRRADNFPMPVSCKLSLARGEQVVKLSKGQKVKVVGHITSTSTVAGVNLGDCDLIELTPSTVITIKANDLAATFAADPKEAENKYKGKEMIVEGKVTDKKSQGNNDWVLSLEAAGGLVVTCRIDGQADVARLNKGDAVRVRCVYETLSVGKFLVLGDAYVLKGK